MKRATLCESVSKFGSGVADGVAAASGRGVGALAGRAPCGFASAGADAGAAAASGAGFDASSSTGLGTAGWEGAVLTGAGPGAGDCGAERFDATGAGSCAAVFGAAPATGRDDEAATGATDRADFELREADGRAAGLGEAGFGAWVAGAPFPAGTGSAAFAFERAAPRVVARERIGVSQGAGLAGAADCGLATFSGAPFGSGGAGSSAAFAFSLAGRAAFIAGSAGADFAAAGVAGRTGAGRVDFVRSAVSRLFTGSSLASPSRFRHNRRVCAEEASQSFGGDGWNRFETDGGRSD